MQEELRHSTLEDVAATYERTLAAVAGGGEAVAFAYARTALQAILTAEGIGAGDEVILSPLTCKVIPLALLAQGIRPVYADIATGTLNLDPDRAEAAISPRTKAIIFQHTYGTSQGSVEAADLTSSRGLILIEDCAQNLPWWDSSHRPGQLGKVAIFSTNLRKPLPAGSGGAAITRDPTLAATVRAYRDQLPFRPPAGERLLRLESWVHAQVLRPALYWPLFELARSFRSGYREAAVGEEIASEITAVSFRPSPFQLLEGLQWLGLLPEMAARRREHSRAYRDAVADLTRAETVATEGDQPLYYFPLLVDDKRGLLRAAKLRCIEIAAWPIWTPIFPVEEEAALQNYGYSLGSCPVAEQTARRLVGLPTDHLTRDRHRQAVIGLLQATLRPRQ
ncbi:MAG TPA: DegT/DnrJ/EryC1/StrS family aminotransferase [Gemmatimonadales bacterium]|nr:DegT/DnrJ/EryC1/StrS family aminotransferase [Gemmatimonadales bacterium]